MRICLALLYCLIVSSLFAQEASTTETEAPDTTVVERKEKTFNFYPGGKALIQFAVPANVRIIGWDKGSVLVEYEKIAYGLTPEEATLIFEQFPVRIRYNQTSTKIQVAAVPPEGVSLEYNITVYVPGYRTDIKTELVKGDYSVESVNGWIEVTTKQGNLKMSSISGYFSGTTEKGDIWTEMSGNRWEGLEFGASTGLGAIDLLLPEGYDTSLKLETKAGTLTVDYPPNIEEGEEVPLKIGIRNEAQAIDSKINKGGPPLTLVTTAGDIRLLKKD